jgi:hypothetical protein
MQFNLCKDNGFNEKLRMMNKENVASYKTAESIGMKRIKEYQDEFETLLVYCIKK